MNKEIGKSLALGSTAGAAGTALIRGMMMLTQRCAPETLPPMKDDPGHFTQLIGFKQLNPPL